MCGGGGERGGAGGSDGGAGGGDGGRGGGGERGRMRGPQSAQSVP
jgi:hypothetical protein